MVTKEPVCSHCEKEEEVDNPLISDGDHYYHVKCEMEYFEFTED